MKKALILLLLAPTQLSAQDACACGDVVDPCLVGAWADNTGKQGFINSSMGLWDVFVSLNEGGSGEMNGQSFEWSNWQSNHESQSVFESGGVFGTVFTEQQVTEFASDMQGMTVTGIMEWDVAGETTGLFCAAEGLFCIYDGRTVYSRSHFRMSVTSPMSMPIASTNDTAPVEIPPGQSTAYTCEGDTLIFTVAIETSEGSSEVEQAMTRTD
jgi:hypothetical protein